MPTYNPKAIEPRWQHFWEEHKTFRTPDQSDKPKFYILDMFPYPSGAGLHVGHPEGYTATDILARYRRMRGFNVLHPMGWDAFGLPAEQYAIETGTHPRLTTQKNIDTFRRQIQMLGFSYDWDREVDTTDPELLQLDAVDLPAAVRHLVRRRAEARAGRSPSCRSRRRCRSQGEAAVRAYQDGKRLAYQAEVPVNWCPALGTVLANEEVIDGKSERGGHPVVRMPLRQWMLRITAYADRLLDDLDLVDWPESIKEMQRNWIGRSEGAEVDFALARRAGERALGRQRSASSPPGPTRCSAPPTWCWRRSIRWSSAITTPQQRAAVEAYQAEAARKSDLERTELAKKKTGVFTGAYAINPVNSEQIPIWIADYVLASYGTGAIMAVPAHDERDFEFAKQFGLPIRTVVRPPDEWLQADRQHAGQPDRGVHRRRHRPSTPARSTVCRRRSSSRRSRPGWRSSGLGTRKVNYKLRDWLFSRQRYWGEPFPILHEVDAQGKPTGVDRAAVAGASCRCACRTGGLQAVRQAGAAAGQGDRLAVRHARRQALPARDQHHAAVGRLVLVLPALPRPAQRQGVLRPGKGEVLDAGRSVRRRRRARRAAPALLALLAQGAVRPRPRPHAGAVPEAGQPGHDPGRDGVHRLQEGRPMDVGREVDADDVAKEDRRQYERSS